MNIDREVVFELIDGERAYQNAKPENSSKIDEETAVAAWIIFMRHHLQNAENEVYMLDQRAALCEIRKIAALAVACMEHNETPRREKE